MDGRTRFAPVLAGLAVLAVLAAAVPRPAEALPLYAQRAGRTCANCHVSPTLEDPEGWEDPALVQRKCNLSCQICHVNPTGAGLRTAAGMYFGQSTLPMLPTQQRSYSDHGRELLGSDTVWRFRQAFDREAPSGVPSDWQSVQDGVGRGRTGPYSAIGSPLGGPSRLGPWDGRYDDLNADPFLRFGGDFRLAYYSMTGALFPMQSDLHLAVHPVEHVTVHATGSLRGNSDGGLDASPVYARNAFVMVHELPAMAYVRAGRFAPAFGTFLADHTSFTRSYFGLGQGDPERQDWAAEVGLAPNYPFANAGVTAGGIAYGAAGWRDLGWSASGHFMVGPDLRGAGVAWGFNPIRYSNAVPLTYLGELSFGWEEDIRFTAMFHQVSWLVFNGLVANLKYDYGHHPSLAPDGQHRILLGADVTVVRGVSFLPTGHLRWTGDQRELFLLWQTHLWL